MDRAGEPGQLKAQLARTWPVLFARHGRLTDVQRQAIPPILAGRDTLVIAPTASGKTEAVVAPLLERYVVRSTSPAPTLHLIYLCPTRALVRDLHERLAGPLDQLGVALAMKTGDTAPVSVHRPPALLITTPESLDALIARAPRLLAPLEAIVLDEIHMLDGTVRGDQLRCLLTRIELIRAYREPGAVDFDPPGPLQRVALSATIGDPAGIAERYLTDAVTIHIHGGRETVASYRRLFSLDDLVTALAERTSRKMLIFCNTRHEVEQVAAYLRHHLSYDAQVFAHYSNLDPGVRREVEAGFSAASVAVCVSSSTLELGIDIGSIDDIVLLGAPHSRGSFLQRVGRGGRRTGAARVLCLGRTPAEELRFAALLTSAEAPSSLQGGRPYHFKPSVLVQQVFSLLKQSPTGALRFADLRAIAPASVPDNMLRALLAELSATRYLIAGRPGEWRPGPGLADLADKHEIYVNFGDSAPRATVIDTFSGRRLAQVKRSRRRGESLLLSGRSLEVAWRSAFTFGVRANAGGIDDETPRIRTAPYAIPLEMTQAMAAELGLAAGQLPAVRMDGETWLFHFWGDLYGDLLAALLETAAPARADVEPIEALCELCLRLPFRLAALPPWNADVVAATARHLARRLEPTFELGRFQSLLPPDLRLHSVLDHCDLPRFAELYQSAALVEVSDALQTALLVLVTGGDAWEAQT